MSFHTHEWNAWWRVLDWNAAIHYIYKSADSVWESFFLFWTIVLSPMDLPFYYVQKTLNLNVKLITKMANSAWSKFSFDSTHAALLLIKGCSLHTQ